MRAHKEQPTVQENASELGETQQLVTGQQGNGGGRKVWDRLQKQHTRFMKKFTYGKHTNICYMLTLGQAGF